MTSYLIILYLDKEIMIISTMISGRLFPEARDPSTRQGITSRLLALDQPIPTLHSLLKNLRYLEPAVEVIKHLIPKPITGTLREALRFHFCEAQYNEVPVDIKTTETWQNLLGS
jgi:hypothetical protein